VIVIGRPFHKLAVFGTKEYIKEFPYKHDGWTWSESEPCSEVNYVDQADQTG